MAVGGPGNFFYLLGGVLILLIAAPLVAQRFENVVGVAFTVTLVVGVWSLARSRRVWLVGMALAGVSLISRGMDISPGPNAPQLVNWTISFAFCLLSLWIVIREVIFGEHLDANRIAGAVCAYLLMGVLWAIAYDVIHLLDPESFSGIPLGADVSLSMLYYSFVTLTTLGYGDISPLSHLAHTLSYLEAVAGVMYMAILVASLIGSFAASAASRPGPGSPE